MTIDRLPGDRWRPAGLRLLADLVAMAASGAGSDPGGRTPTLPSSQNQSSHNPSSHNPSSHNPSSQDPSSRSPSSETPASGAQSERIEALVTLAQAGDPDAFGLLYEHYVDEVYRYVHLRVGSVALAEDITAETFLRALRRLDGFTWQGRDIAAWFVTIARNLIIDHRRSSRYRLEISTDELLDVEQHARRSGAGGPTPEQEVVDRDRDRALVDAVRRLRPDQQECVVLRFFNDLTIAQTALAMGRTEGAVKQLQLRAVRSLADLLGSTS